LPNLYPLQDADRRRLAASRFQLLAYEPGSGKTPVALRAAQDVAPAGPWLVVTVRNALLQWQEELRAWAPRTWLTGGRVTVTNWEQMDKPAILEAARAAHVLIFDEIHEARNMETATWQNAYKLTQAPAPGGAVRRIWGLTGTPVVNGPVDLVGQIILLGAYTPAQAWGLKARFTNPQLGGIRGPVDYSGAANLPELRRLLDPFTIRRRFADFGMSMPPVTFTNWAVPVDPGNLGTEYTAAAGDFSAWYQSTRGRAVPPLARFTTLRRLLSRAKVAGVAAKLKTELALGYKILVFSEFRDTVQTLHGMFPGSGLILGGDTPGARLEVLEAVRGSQNAHVIFASAGALDTAVNLQSISRVFYVDLGWTPAGFDQTLKRSWRYLQKLPVSIVRFFVEADPLEQFIVGVLLRKERVLADLGLESTASLRAFNLK